MAEELATVQVSKPIKFYHLQITRAQLKQLNALEKKNTPIKEIERLTGVNHDQVYKVRKMKQNGSYHTFAMKVLRSDPQFAIKRLNGLKHRKVSRTGHPALGKMLALEKKGVPRPEIARRLNISQSLVYYHLNKNKGGMNGNITRVATNGVATRATKEEARTPNAPSKGELIGYAWCEIERGITNISQRIAVDGSHLRRRLSELLAVETLR